MICPWQLKNILQVIPDYRSSANAFNHLEKGGLFLSESRSIKDSIFGTGDKINNRIYKTSHQRRFLKKNELLKDLKNIGFIIDDVIESKGLAVYKDSDPVVIRIVARKP